MEVAVFSDIHGNYRAFEKCLKYALDRKISTFIFLGDYLGEFAYPLKTIQMLYDIREKYQCFFIRGNKEDYWLNRRQDINCEWKNGNSTVYSMNYNFANLTSEDLNFFEGLPICSRIDFEGLPSIIICHGSPCNNSEKLIATNKNFSKIVDDCECDYILCGHSHIQQFIEHNGKKVINPGAVGVPLHSENGKSQFMLLKSGKNAWSHEFVSLEYNKDDVIRDLWESGLYEKTPHWCRITEHLIRTGEVSHGSVLMKAIELCETKEGSCKWYDIPEKYWEVAINELVGPRDIKANADRILYEFGLLKKLEEMGNAHIIGSYRMDMMAWNDLDVDIENENMSLDKLYKLSEFIIETFKPVWYEAKEELNAAGQKVWFHGFETMITGELWNIDLWFFDKKTIHDAEIYCDNIAKNASRVQKENIIKIKSELISRGLYSFEQYKSIDVYKAVLENDVTDINEFLKFFEE